MNGPEILASFRDQLAGAVADHTQNIARPEPIAVSPWVAMSLLQKAIRRGEEGFALQAAATLMVIAPDRLWRRLGGIAFEDIGLADLETVSLVTAALGGKRVREKVGGEWPVASYFVSRMVLAQKCRAADDLLMTALAHPAFARDRMELATLPTGELLEIATGHETVVCRALALWFAMGTNQRQRSLPARVGAPQAVFDHLCEEGVPHSLVEVCREGFRRTGEMLPPLVSLLYSERRGAQITAMHDGLPPAIMIGSVPSWCLDMYSWEGKAALKRFLGTEAQTARWIRSNVPAASRVDFLGGTIFRVEGGLMRQRHCWSLGDQLRHMMEVEANPHCPDARDILSLARADIGLLNEVRNVR